MTTGAVAPPGLRVRTAVPQDNPALVALAAACPMEGATRLCVERDPDFFALTRIEGETCTVAVAEHPGRGVIGCVSAAERVVWLDGVPSRTAYLGDLKVHPSDRRQGIADALSRWCVEACGAIGPHLPVLVSVLEGNRPMERRASGRPGVPALRRIGTLDAWAVPALWYRRLPVGIGLTAGRARAGDLDAMAAAWTKAGRRRQFAPVLDRDALADWIARAPGLEVTDYLVAWRGAQLAGFLGLWNQAVFKRTRILGYAPGAALFRLGFNAAAPLLGAPPVPPAGSLLPHRVAVQLCVPDGDAAVLRSLLVAAHNAARDGGEAFFTVGIDRADPLAAAVRGMMAQPTPVGIYVTTARGPSERPERPWPLHYEIALT